MIRIQRDYSNYRDEQIPAIFLNHLLEKVNHTQVT